MANSSIVTGGVTVSAAMLVPLVTWALHGFPQPIPDTVPYLIAAGLVTAGHALYNIAMSPRATPASIIKSVIEEASKNPTQPDNPVQP